MVLIHQTILLLKQNNSPPNHEAIEYQTNKSILLIIIGCNISTCRCSFNNEMMKDDSKHGYNPQQLKIWQTYSVISCHIYLHLFLISYQEYGIYVASNQAEVPFAFSQFILRTMRIASGNPFSLYFNVNSSFYHAVERIDKRRLIK